MFLILNLWLPWKCAEPSSWEHGWLRAPSYCPWEPKATLPPGCFQPTIWQEYWCWPFWASSDEQVWLRDSPSAGQEFLRIALQSESLPTQPFLPNTSLPGIGPASWSAASPSLLLSTSHLSVPEISFSKSGCGICCTKDQLPTWVGGSGEYFKGSRNSMFNNNVFRLYEF